MTSIKIDRESLNKLNHESIEIRLRTLEQLSSKLHRALALNGTIEFKPGDLCKQLIRWFGFLPIQQPLKVLNLLQSILESPKYGSKAVDKLGSERLIKELRKIQTLFDDHSSEHKVISKMKELLKNQRLPEDKTEIRKHSDELEELIQSASNMKIGGEIGEYNFKDYEIPWSLPSPSDYTSMKFLSDILINKFASTTEIENAIQHLQLIMFDYPAEYLLQAPHIFQNLLKTYDERNNEIQPIVVDVVARALLQFLIILEKRLKILRKSTTYQENRSEQKTNQTPCQLKFEKALTALFDASVFHLESHSAQGNVSPCVWQIIFMVLQLIEEVNRDVEILCLYKIASIVANLSIKFAETEHCARLRLHQMLLIFILQDVARVITVRNPLKGVEVFEPILRDYTMKSFYSTRHEIIEALVLKADKSLNQKYQILKLYEGSFETSIEMLINRSNMSCSELIKEGNSVCTVLDMLQSKQLIDILFGAVVQGIPLYATNVQLKAQSIELLLKLLNLTFMPLKIHLYEKLSVAFKRHIGCLMTGERYAVECSNADLLKAHIVGVPLSTELLLQFVHDSFESSCDQIQSNCCKILELLLQSQTLFGTNWWSLLPIVVPLLPLLNCCTLSEKMMDLLLKLYDPDLRQLPYVSVLQGNLGFLFHSNADRRSEALTRLIYTLNSLKDAEKYEPNLIEISDTLPNDICLQNTAREYRNIFSDRLPVRCDVVASLNNLLDLLDSPDVEPLIRKTSLMQINVLCCNWRITAELCSVGACYLILKAIENALQKSSGLDYPDAAVPAISILNKIMLYDASVRCELAETPNIYVLLVRALMMFHHDIQLRQDATMCLFQLLFSAQLISTENCIEGPFILGNIQIPLNINLRSALTNKIQQEPEKLSSMFASALEETQYWRMVVASTYCGGLANITQKTLPLLAQLDVRKDLKLTSQDVRLIRATQPGVSINRLLNAAINATDHRSLIQAFQLLKQQLIVPTLKDTFSVNDEFCLQLNIMLKRYLQMPPGNNNDLELYENLLDVTNIIFEIPLLLVVLEIFKILIKDPRHALVAMITQREEIPLRIFHKITTLLKHLVNEHKHVCETHFNASECSTFYSNLFDLFIERCLQLFEIRDLQRVRCLLSLIVAMSSCQLDMPDQLLFFYCRRFAQLSLALKSFTQTGAQWHRDCFLAILQLCNQMENPTENFRLTAGFVKYLSGLCGHNDVEVRTLAWSILNVSAKTKALEISGTERKSSDISGTDLLVSELSYLPGGFMACCLSTLLDAEEAICVRHMAGQLMATLIRSQEQVEEIEKLVEQHNFTRSATEALTLTVCILEKELPIDLDASTTNVTTYELISCYSLICIELSLRSPDFLKELCTRSLMFKLYEILKLPPPVSKHIGYLNMIGHICQLYTMCYSNNFVFLQRTICRDAVWLSSFCQILFGIVAPSEEIYNIINMLQLLLVLCKDSTALELLSIKLQDYSADIVNLFQDALIAKNLNTRLQGCSLSVLNILLIKSQPEIDKDLSIHIQTLFESERVLIKSIRCNDDFESDNKENNENIGKEKINKKFNENIVKDNKLNIAANKIEKSSISEHLCISLIRLFTHLYPTKVCKFSTPPNANQQHVIETLALLLKQSPVAQETAQNLKLQVKVVKIFKNFLDEFATTSCTTYVKRNGEKKKMAVIKNIQLLLKLLISWYSSATMMITDNVLAVDYSKILIQIWPWLAHSNDLKLTVLQVCAFLSERSLVVCKQFSSLNNVSFPHSVLQLVAKMMTADTLKIKANSTDCSQLISAGLRVLINCCSCIEGRTALNKIHALDIFDSLHPFNPKATQLKLDIVIAWLEFWELFSRYDEGASSHHLNALCSVVNKSTPSCARRIISLRILRNMAFLNSNRSTLITSTDFIFTVNEIVSQPIKSSVEEQFIVCVALWKLISGGIKFVAMIRGTKLAKHLRLLKENLTCTEDENDETIEYSNDLLNVLNVMFKIFNN
ncbi:protein rotatin homolog [Calliphora vicina]|uniref:protein rotatin homolog n=1 Tax=Calliphora vicina TaxID=7373 RepID=UPI00325B60FB